MNEVEKMYENANIKQDRMCEWTCRGSEYCSTNCEHYESTQLYYPPFTAEKQLELIKWLALRDTFDMMAWQNGECHIEHDKYNANENSLENCLARLFNDLWQDLTEEERKQIKEILE